MGSDSFKPIVARLGDHSMDNIAPADNPEDSFDGGWTLFWATGNSSTSAIYSEIEPGKQIGPHADSAEEIFLVLEGEVEATVGGATVSLEPGMLIVFPAMAVHSTRNVGATRSRHIGFMGGNTVVTTFPEGPVLPFNTQVLGTPPPDVAASLGYKKP
ncbi:MAG TPA: cupin domain-containing protein [Actinomycetota bacterium]|nr:cupin domain-containing protein [Actinomycetota bacterium]